MTKRVCVVGATGHLGSSVVEGLRARGMAVVAVARNSSSANVQWLRELGATVMFVDASKPQESYTTAVSSCQTAISCLAASFTHAEEVFDFWAIDRDANIRFGAEALEAGVRHLLLVSTFEGRASRNVSAFSAAKEEAVDVLARECERRGVTFTVLRPNAYFKDLTDYAFDRVLREGRHKVLGDGSHRINPIAREDVASFIVDCVQREPAAAGGEYLLGGPDTFSFREIGVLAAKVIGKEQELKIQSVPLLWLSLMAVVMSVLGFISQKARCQAAVLRWMTYCSTHDALAPCCGKRRLLDHYRRKKQLIDKLE